MSARRNTPHAPRDLTNNAGRGGGRPVRPDAKSFYVGARSALPNSGLQLWYIETTNLVSLVRTRPASDVAHECLTRVECELVFIRCGE